MTWGRMQNPIRGLLHGSAAVAAAIGLGFLLSRSRGVTPWPAAALFGFALVAMFTVSALYHSVPWTERWRERIRRVDHSLIFIVVAATFTPLAFAALEGVALAVGLTLVWGVAAVGIVLKMVLRRPRVGLSVLLQMVMGWSALIWLPRFASRLGWEAVALILAGGACYTVGTVVFATRRPRLAPRVFSHHELFHVLVVAGALFHFWAVAGYAI
ncbi:MAG: PAQR family membrane homeostasis protein TrhA [Actinomycetota bacterium]